MRLAGWWPLGLKDISGLGSKVEREMEREREKRRERERVYNKQKHCLQIVNNTAAAAAVAPQQQQEDIYTFSHVSTSSTCTAASARALVFVYESRNSSPLSGIYLSKTKSNRFQRHHARASSPD